MRMRSSSGQKYAASVAAAGLKLPTCRPVQAHFAACDMRVRRVDSPTGDCSGGLRSRQCVPYSNGNFFPWGRTT